MPEGEEASWLNVGRRKVDLVNGLGGQYSCVHVRQTQRLFLSGAFGD